MHATSKSQIRIIARGLDNNKSGVKVYDKQEATSRWSWTRSDVASNLRSYLARVVRAVHLLSEGVLVDTGES